MKDKDEIDISEEDDRKDELERKILQGAAAERVSRFGHAAKEHLVAFSGKDNEARKDIKGLKKISKSKVHPEYKKINVKQQAGFAAEVKSVARKNAENILGGNSERYTKTDDIGQTNHPIFDIEKMDVNGNIINGQGAQVKFVGGSPEQLLKELQSKKYQKYLDANAILDIPDDFYDALVGKDELIDKKIANLKQQIRKTEEQGKTDVALEKEARLKDLRKIKKSLRKSGLTNEEAIEARNNPKLSTANDIGKLAHQAGIEQAKTGVVISGSVSVVKNVVGCMKGEIEPQDAAKDVVKDAGKGAAFSYATAFSGTVVKGAMQNSSSSYIRSLSKTNLAAGLVSTTLNTGKTMKKYLKGELTGAQCIEQLGEQGVGEIGAAMYSAIAVAAVSGTGSAGITIVAGMAGSTLGYGAAVAVYKELSTSLKEYDLAVEERKRVEAECAEAIELICQYRKEMNEIVEEYLVDHLEIFDTGFKAMDTAIIQNDTNGFIAGNVLIQEKLGREIQFNSKDEFNDFMTSDDSLKL